MNKNDVVPNPDLKGRKNGNCNRTSCQRPGATWFNHSTRAYYCQGCALLLNRENLDAETMYGHPLCTGPENPLTLRAEDPNEPFCVSTQVEAPFNDLTPAEVERVSLLMEELGEVSEVVGRAIQAAGKVLRHGYGAYDADQHQWIKDGHPSNREMLEKEAGDVSLAIDFLIERGDISGEAVAKRKVFKRRAIGRYLHHQGSVEVIGEVLAPATAGTGFASRKAGYAKDLLGMLSERFQMEEMANAWTDQLRMKMEAGSPQAVAVLFQEHPRLLAHCIHKDEKVFRVEIWERGARREDGDIAIEGRNGLDLFLGLAALLARL